MASFKQFPKGSIIGSGSYVFRRYGETPKQEVTVNCTGSTKSGICTVSNADGELIVPGIYTMYTGETMFFNVYGSSSYPGRVYVEVNGEPVMITNITASAAVTVTWTLPSNISTVTVECSYVNTTWPRKKYGYVTVTAA